MVKNDVTNGKTPSWKAKEVALKAKVITDCLLVWEVILHDIHLSMVLVNVNRLRRRRITCANYSSRIGVSQFNRALSQFDSQVIERSLIASWNGWLTLVSC